MWLAKAEMVGELRSSWACCTKSHTEMRAAMVPQQGSPRKGNCRREPQLHRGWAGCWGHTAASSKGRRKPLGLTHPHPKQTDTLTHTQAHSSTATNPAIIS